MNKTFERNFISNQNGTDKVNSKSESFDFTGFLTSHTENKGALEHIYFRNDLGVRLFEHVHVIERRRYMVNCVALACVYSNSDLLAQIYVDTIKTAYAYFTVLLTLKIGKRPPKFITRGTWPQRFPLYTPLAKWKG